MKQLYKPVISNLIYPVISLITLSFGLQRCASKSTPEDKNSGDAAPALVEGNGIPCPGLPASVKSNVLPDLQMIDGSRFKLRVLGQEKTLCQRLLAENKKVLIAQVSQPLCSGCVKIFKGLTSSRFGNGDSTNYDLSLSFPETDRGANDPTYTSVEEDMRSEFGLVNGQAAFGFDVGHALFDAFSSNKTVPIVVIMDRFQRGYVVNNELVQRLAPSITEENIVQNYLKARIEALANASQ